MQAVSFEVLPFVMGILLGWARAARSGSGAPGRRGAVRSESAVRREIGSPENRDRAAGGGLPRRGVPSSRRSRPGNLPWRRPRSRGMLVRAMTPLRPGAAGEDPPVPPSSRAGPPGEPRTWDRVHELLHEAIELDPVAREAFLANLEREAPGLAGEVRSLLAAHEASDDFLASPPLSAFSSTVAPGDRLGSYRIVEEIGRGGMGVVYRATRDDEDFTKEVAIKLIDPDALQSDPSPLPRGAADPRRAEPPGDRAALRRRHDRRRRAVPGHGARRRPSHRCLVCGEGAFDPRRPRALPEGVRCRAVRARAPGRAPGSQARQHPRTDEATAEAARLRNRQASARTIRPPPTRE